MKPILLQESCLLVVDVQCGFTTLCPEELPVPEGLAIVPFINQLLKADWARIDASQDWHPPDHRSFFGQKDNLYPPHCVAGSKGAEFLPDLDMHRFHTIWRKGFQRDVEAYAITAQHPAYPQLLQASRITTVVVCGLAINICCFFAARDLRQAGFRVLLVEDAGAGIDVPKANLFQDRTKQDGQRMGIEYVRTQDVLQVIMPPV